MISDQQNRIEKYFDKTEFSLNQMGRSLYTEEYNNSYDSSMLLDNDEDVQLTQLIQGIKINLIKSIMLEHEKNQILLREAEESYLNQQLYLMKKCGGTVDAKSETNNETKCDGIIETDSNMLKENKSGYKSFRRIISSFKFKKKSSNITIKKLNCDNNSSDSKQSRIGSVPYSVIGLFTKSNPIQG